MADQPKTRADQIRDTEKNGPATQRVRDYIDEKYPTGIFPNAAGDSHLEDLTRAAEIETHRNTK